MIPPTPTHTFLARWPILDPARTIASLRDEAACELDQLVSRAHARLVGPGRWAIADSARVPGSGGITPTVLVFTAPAIEAERRPYWADLP